MVAWLERAAESVRNVNTVQIPKSEEMLLLEWRLGGIWWAVCFRCCSSCATMKPLSGGGGGGSLTQMCSRATGESAADTHTVTKCLTSEAKMAEPSWGLHSSGCISKRSMTKVSLKTLRWWWIFLMLAHSLPETLNFMSFIRWIFYL